jgi:hypothetical protein
MGHFLVRPEEAMTPVSPETMARELLACPFCGNDRPKIRSNGIGDYYVVCDGDEDAVHCEASTSDRRCETVEGAVRRWNRRAGYSAALAAPLTEEEVDAMARAQHECMAELRAAFSAFLPPEKRELLLTWDDKPEAFKDIARKEVRAAFARLVQLRTANGEKK